MEPRLDETGVKRAFLRSFIWFSLSCAGLNGGLSDHMDREPGSLFVTCWVAAIFRLIFRDLCTPLSL